MTRLPGSHSASPTGRWRQRLNPIVGHPQRTGVLVVGALLLFGLVYLRILGERVPWQVGQHAPRDIRAHAFTSYVDSAATEQKKAEARASAQAVFTPRIAAAARDTDDAITAVFERTRNVRLDETTPITRSLKLRDALPVQLSEDTRRTLATASDPELAVIFDMAHRLAAERMTHEIRDRGNDLREAQALVTSAAKRLAEPKPQVEAAAEIAQQALRPNSEYDADATAQVQQEAEADVESVRRTIMRNELIIAAGDTVEQVHIDMLNALGLVTPGEMNLAARLLAAAATVALMLGVFGYYLHRFRPRYLERGRYDGLILGCFVAAAVVARLGSRGEAYEATDLAAVAALAIVLAALLDTEVAMVAAVFMAFCADMATPASDPRLIVVAALAGIVAAFTAGAGGSRTNMIARTAVVCPLANVFLAGAFATVFGLPIALEQLALAGAGGVLAAFVAAGAILVLERPLRIVTEVRLLELSSANEPILKRLALEAPGTYASSIGVANLAEAAADAVKADALLVRVGAYYHDIGKLKRPYYFIENQQGHANPHDRLTPSLSARVIISHVKDGLELADEIGLPAEVRAFICQHHGTTLVEYFYERALQEATEGEEILEAAFRYPGPRPHSREAAILMLADTVEAAARTLGSVTLDSLRTMVHNLIHHKIEDGQLDDCDLTFANIHAVEDALVRSLYATYHQRIKYPEHLDDQHRPANGRSAVSRASGQ
jgi:putative nucleotidyltransferase with HDIG domain